MNLLKTMRKYSLAILLIVLNIVPIAVADPVSSQTQESLIAAIVEGGPFTLGHKYPSMAGPEFVYSFKVEDLVASKRIQLPESMIIRLENLVPTGERSIPEATVSSSTQQPKKPIGWIKETHQPRTLYWYRGARFDVLDEKGRIIPNGEFLCHGAVNVYPQRHNRLFPEATTCINKELCTATQGITQVMLPAGFGVPLASDESLQFVLSSRNPTGDRRKSIVLRCTVYLVADKDVHKPITALNFCELAVGVLLGKSKASLPACPSSCCMSTAEAAPTHYIIKRLYEKQHKKYGETNDGQEFTHHWILPPGTHVYRTPIGPQDSAFALNGPVQAADPHLHPFCTELRLVEYRKDHKANTLLKLHCRTTISPIIEANHIDYLSLSKGIPLNKEAQYGLEVICNNTTGVNQDAMASAVFFFKDLKFKKPLWAQDSSLF